MHTHAYLHVHSMHTLCAQRLETHFFMYTHMPSWPAIICTHAHLHVHSMHTLCAETRDTLLYVYIHAWVARIHAHTCIPTRATYIVRRGSRHAHICVRTCLASTHSCAHMHSHRGTCIVYIHCAQRLETRPHLRTHMPC